MKTAKNFRLSDGTLEQMEWLGAQANASATDVIEDAVREKYEREMGKLRLRAIKVEKDRYNLVAGELVLATINQSVLDATRGYKKQMLSEDGANPSVIGMVFLATAIAKNAYVGWNKEAMETLQRMTEKETA